jgi:hypothetical protein
MVNQFRTLKNCRMEALYYYKQEIMEIYRIVHKEF